MVVNGTKPSDWARVAALAKQHPWIVPSFGLHPWYLEEAGPDWFETLCGYLDGLPCAVGEIGLDRSRVNPKDKAALELQEKFFLRQLELAATRGVPVSIHCVRTWGRFFDLLSSHPLPKCGFLIHSYSGPIEMIKQFVSLGAYFSFSGAILADNKGARREALKHVPLDRLLFETDAPFQPASIAQVYLGLAEYLGRTPEELLVGVEANFMRLFGGVWRDRGFEE
jgi:TatD DNase family protein